MSLPSWGVYSLLYFLFFRITLAQPQTTAVCGPTFSWVSRLRQHFLAIVECLAQMNNTDGQSPCLVAAYAFSACTSTSACPFTALFHEDAKSSSSFCHPVDDEPRRNVRSPYWQGCCYELRMQLCNLFSTHRVFSMPRGTGT